VATFVLVVTVWPLAREIVELFFGGSPVPKKSKQKIGTLGKLVTGYIIIVYFLQ
jgi:hypothetical protein